MSKYLFGSIVDKNKNVKLIKVYEYEDIVVNYSYNTIRLKICESNNLVK
jgi:hypothetical protein